MPATAPTATAAHGSVLAPLIVTTSTITNGQPATIYRFINAIDLQDDEPSSSTRDSFPQQQVLKPAGRKKATNATTGVESITTPSNSSTQVIVQVLASRPLINSKDQQQHLPASRRASSTSPSKDRSKIVTEVATQSYIHIPGSDKRSDRWIPSSLLSSLPVPPELEPTKSEHQKEEEDLGLDLVRNIDKLYFGRWCIDVWYNSPYPIGISMGSSGAVNAPASYQERLFVCPLCLLYFFEANDYKSHCAHCNAVTPGDLIYKNGDFLVYLVDGKTDKFYAQCLCLAGKLFLDHKTLMYDSEPFLFYVLVQTLPSVGGGEGVGGKTEVLGFFSKEKQSPEFHNLSCILVFPPHQQQGHGRFLIELSYDLYRQNGLVGGPERPLSDLGLLGYMRYWKIVLLCLLHENAGISLNLREVSIITAFRITDILATLSQLGLLSYWSGGGNNESNPSLHGQIRIPLEIVQQKIVEEKINFTRLVEPDCFLLP